MDLIKAIQENERIDVPFGIGFKELKSDKTYHNLMFYDKWGIPWKYFKGILYYSDDTYCSKRKKKRWEEAYMGGCDLPHKKYFTPEEFETIKPAYL